MADQEDKGIRVTLPNGKTATVYGTTDVSEAIRQVQEDYETNIRPAEAKKEFAEAPILSQIRMALGDPLNQLTHGMTAGLFDRGFDWATGAKSAEETAKGAERMGPVPTALARAGGAMMLPSSAPRAVGTIGGGPLMKTLTGATVGGLEGATYGGIEAAATDKSVPMGMLAGGAGGVVGQGLGQAAGSAANSFAKWMQGIKDAPSPRNITTFGNIKTPSAKDRIDVAAARAASKGKLEGTAEAAQAAQKEEFEKLLTGSNKGQFTPRQREMMGNIAYGDTGTRIASKVGGFLENPLIAGALGGAAGFGSGGVLPGILTAATSKGAGKVMTMDAAKATQEAVDDLRRMMQGKRKYRGPMTTGRQRTLGQGLGVLGMTGLEDYLE